MARELAAEKGPDATVLINLSGRGDKDMGTATEWFRLGEPDDETGEPGRERDHRGTATAFETARAEGRAALVGYLPAGYPSVEGSIEAMKAMVDAGCDVIEVGLPYSDPVMDGPTIQAAAQAALEAGTRTSDVMRVVEAVAATGTPTVVMTYWNPVERYGVERFAADLAARRGSGAHHARPHPRLGVGVDRRRRRPRARQGLPRRPEQHRGAGRHDDRRLPRLRLRHRRHGRDRRPDHDQRPGRPARGPHQGHHRPARSASGSASAPATRRPRWRRTPTGSSSGSAFVRALLDHADDPAAGIAALRTLTEDLADGVRRA